MPNPSHVARLAGSWSLTTVPPRPAPTTRLQLTIDSVTERTFRTRVVFFMQGNMGTDPARFEPTYGLIRGDTVALTIKLLAEPRPAGRLAGVLAGDTIQLTEYEWRGENRLAADLRWVLLRKP